MGMTETEFARKKKLGDEVYEIWTTQLHHGKIRPTRKQKDKFIEAYWAGVLPRLDPNKSTSLYQWVEDNFPEII